MSKSRATWAKSCTSTESEATSSIPKTPTMPLCKCCMTTKIFCQIRAVSRVQASRYRGPLRIKIKTIIFRATSFRGLTSAALRIPRPSFHNLANIPQTAAKRSATESKKCGRSRNRLIPVKRLRGIGLLLLQKKNPTLHALPNLRSA